MTQPCFEKDFASKKRLKNNHQTSKSIKNYLRYNKFKKNIF